MKEKTETQYRNQTLYRHPFNVHSREVATRFFMEPLSWGLG